MEQSHEGMRQKSIIFCGDRLLTVETTSGYFISLPTLCTALSLNYSGQLQRLQRSKDLVPYLQQYSIRTPGGHQRIWCLHSKGVNAWLAGIRQTRIKPTTMEKLQRYRDDLMEALATSSGDIPDNAGSAPINPYHQSEPLAVREAHPIALTDEDQKQKMLAIINNLQPPFAIGVHITTTNSQIDQSIREASLADWENNLYTTSNNLEVYLGTQLAPLPITEAQARLQQIGGSTVLTARVVLGLWNLRRNDALYSLNGSVGIRLDEILAWRGMQKHERSAIPGSTSIRRQDGYRTEQRQQIIHDLEALAMYCVRGTVIGTIRGRQRRIYIDGPYLRHSVVSVETGQGADIIGFFISPGDWIHTFDSSAFHAEIDQRIFRLNPQNQQHELRIALYLVESWRQRALKMQSHGLFQMQELLTASMIDVDHHHMMRFSTRIESALTALWEQGILGDKPQCQSWIDKQQARWKKEWLESFWHLVPPKTIVERYAQWDHSPPSLLDLPEKGGM